MKDPFNLFIQDSVEENTINYYNLMFKTKRKFFEYLKSGKSTEEFRKEINKIWDKVDHSYMLERIEELEKMISARDLEGHEIISSSAKYKEIFDIIGEDKFKDIEKKYKEIISKYYNGRHKTAEKEYIDKMSYLSKLVEKYDDVQQIIPYHNKDGTIHSWHNISSYSSMLYNVNLTHAGWNRTMYDSKLLGNDILYLPAHTMACPLCQEWQGRLYSTNGKTGYIDGQKYIPKEVAIEGGIGHPNCKHQWTLYWTPDQLQEDTYSSNEWVERYEKDQKIKALELKSEKIKNDKSIYKKLGNQEEVDKANQKLEKINSKIRELKNG